MKNPLKIAEIIFLILGTYCIMGCPGAPFSQYIVLERDPEGQNGHTQQIIQDFRFRNSDYTNPSPGNALVSIKIPVKVNDSVNIKTLKNLFPPSDDWKPGEKWEVDPKFYELMSTTFTSPAGTHILFDENTLEIQLDYKYTPFPGGFKRYKPLFKTNSWPVELNATKELSSLGVTVQFQGQPNTIGLICEKYKCKIVDQQNKVINQITIERTITVSKQKLARAKKEKIAEIKKQEIKRMEEERAVRLADKRLKCLHAQVTMKQYNEAVLFRDTDLLPNKQDLEQANQLIQSRFCRNYLDKLYVEKVQRQHARDIAILQSKGYY